MSRYQKWVPEPFLVAPQNGQSTEKQGVQPTTCLLRQLRLAVLFVLCQAHSGSASSLSPCALCAYDNWLCVAASNEQADKRQSRWQRPLPVAVCGLGSRELSLTICHRSLAASSHHRVPETVEAALWSGTAAGAGRRAGASGLCRFAFGVRAGRYEAANPKADNLDITIRRSSTFRVGLG